PIATLHNRAPKIGASALTSVSALFVRVKDDCKTYASILCGECRLDYRDLSHLNFITA
ncbi:hypothetical protein TSAR_009381, partial [Trichomalopsis sarcophagae]